MKKNLTTSFLVLLAAEVIYNVASYATLAGVGRILGPADYGRYSVVMGFATMFTILIARGIPTAMAKRISEYAGDWSMIRGIVRTAANMQRLVVGGVTLLYLLLVPFFVRIFGDPSLTILFYISGFILPFFALSSFKVLYFNGLKSFNLLAVIKMIRGLVRVSAIVGLAFLFSTQGAVIGAVLSPLIVFLCATLIDKLFVAKPRISAQKIEIYPWKDLASYAKTFMLFLFFYEFYVRSDIYLIKAIIGDDATTGFYNAAMTITLIPYYAIFALTFILFPTISGLAKKKDFVGIRALLKKVYIILGTVLPLAAVLFYFFREPFTVLLYGELFRASADLIPYMLGGTIFGTVFYVFASIFNGAGYTKLTASIVGISLLISISANIYLLPIYGIFATAIVFSATSTLMGLTAIVAAQRIFANKNQ